jgi:hypothetical protein
LENFLGIHLARSQHQLLRFNQRATADAACHRADMDISRGAAQVRCWVTSRRNSTHPPSTSTLSPVGCSNLKVAPTVTPARQVIIPYLNT